MEPDSGDYFVVKDPTTVFMQSWKCWRELKEVNPLAAQGLLLYFSFGGCICLFNIGKV